jgi:23S rRNA pseudouridine1911/1915/1917 synthase
VVSADEPGPDVVRLVADEGGERVDRYVADALSEISRTAVQRLLHQGAITVNGARVTVSTRLRTGDLIEVRVPLPQPVALAPEPIVLDVVYEDDDLIVINKPAGLVVHPGAGHASGTLVNAILAHCPDLPGVGGEVRPGIVHRLDKDTSGIIVVAKHDKALHALQRQFKRREVRKRYTALVVGTLAEDDGLIEAPLARDRVHRRRMAVRGDGKPARTRWHVVGRLRDQEGTRFTLLDVELMTGRTHQIRVHFSWMGYPLAGDVVYGRGGAAATGPRQFLHARELELAHPTSGVVMHFTSPLAEDLRQVLEALVPDG